MKDTSKRVGLWGLADGIFTIGLLLLTIGVGAIQTDLASLKEGAVTIGLGVGLIVFGVVIYWLKTKMPYNQPHEEPTLPTPEDLGFPEIHPTEEAKESEKENG